MIFNDQSEVRRTALGTRPAPPPLAGRRLALRLQSPPQAPLIHHRARRPPRLLHLRRLPDHYHLEQDLLRQDPDREVRLLGPGQVATRSLLRPLAPPPLAPD